MDPSDYQDFRDIKSYKDLGFRVIRTHANSVENLPVFGFAVLLAIVAGVSSAWVNWLAIIHLVCRSAFWVIYYMALGKTAGGPRTIVYVLGWLTNMILVSMALFALLAL